MNSLIISYEKYRELHNAVADPVLGAEPGLFRTHFKCDVTIVNAPEKGIELEFDDEKDLVWFRLKWL